MFRRKSHEKLNLLIILVVPIFLLVSTPNYGHARFQAGDFLLDASTSAGVMSTEFVYEDADNQRHSIIGVNFRGRSLVTSRFFWGANFSLHADIYEDYEDITNVRLAGCFGFLLTPNSSTSLYASLDAGMWAWDFDYADADGPTVGVEIGLITHLTERLYLDTHFLVRHTELNIEGEDFEIVQDGLQIGLGYRF